MNTLEDLNGSSSFRNWSASADAAGNRARARHGMAFNSEQYLNDYEKSRGLHAWDIGLRFSTTPLIREKFIEDVHHDLHDAVRPLPLSLKLHEYLLIKCYLKALALDNLTGGFTVILHSHGLPRTLKPGEFLVPQDMQINAYITNREMHRYADPISRIVQIFAADILPSQCYDYASRAAGSGLAADIFRQTIRTPFDPTRLLPKPTKLSSILIFSGYRPGALESFLQPQLVSSASRIPTSRAPPKEVVRLSPSATALRKHVRVQPPPQSIDVAETSVRVTHRERMALDQREASSPILSHRIKKSRNIRRVAANSQGMAPDSDGGSMFGLRVWRFIAARNQRTFPGAAVPRSHKLRVNRITNFKPIQFEPITGLWQQVNFNTGWGFSWLAKDQLAAVIQARYREHLMEERTFTSPCNDPARSALYLARLQRASLEKRMGLIAQRAAALHDHITPKVTIADSALSLSGMVSLHHLIPALMS
ncbi:hypothetical protein HWV62_15651 [Athelia sp. TMB]|nr:hypothetical protein HWV62_15651 [Athelia sp. TMB]